MLGTSAYRLRYCRWASAVVAVVVGVVSAVAFIGEGVGSDDAAAPQNLSKGSVAADDDDALDDKEDDEEEEEGAAMG